MKAARRFTSLRTAEIRRAAGIDDAVVECERPTGTSAGAAAPGAE
jgi:hypothetical protein